MAEPRLLQGKRRQAGGQEDDAQRRGQRLVEAADDGEIDLCGEDLELAPQDDRVTKIGQRLHDGEKKRVRDSRPQERQRHLPEGLPRPRSQGQAGLLQRGIHRFDHAGDH